MTDKSGYWQSFDIFYFCGCAKHIAYSCLTYKHRIVINLKFTLIFDLEENLIIMYLKHKSTRTCPREGLLSVRWTQLTVGRWTRRAVAENWARESDHRWLNHFFVFHHFIKCVVWIERVVQVLCKRGPGTVRRYSKHFAATYNNARSGVRVSQYTPPLSAASFITHRFLWCNRPLPS